MDLDHWPKPNGKGLEASVLHYGFDQEAKINSIQKTAHGLDYSL